MEIKFHSDSKFAIAIATFVFFTAWWGLIQLPVPNQHLLNQLWGGLYGIVALLGAVWGLKISKQWGGLKSLMGKAICMFALGLFAQEFGQLAYNYYIFYRRIEIPYPSMGDVGFFSSVIFYILGAIYLARASGVAVSLQSFKSRMQAFIIPVVMLAYSYFIFLQGYEFDWSNLLTIFLDFGYPLGQAMYVAIAMLAVLLTRGVLGGVMKLRILIIFFALLFQYLCDFMFLYQAHHETWTAGGLNDYMFLVSYLIMTLALLHLRMSKIKPKLS